MREFEFTIKNGQVAGESRVEGDATTPVHIPSDATFSIGTGTITETLKTDHGIRVLDFSQDASDPSVYDLVKTSWGPSQGSGDGSAGHHGSGGDGWTGVGLPGAAHGPGPAQLPGETWDGGHGSGVSDPAPSHGPGPADVPGLATQIAQMHATGGSLI